MLLYNELIRLRDRLRDESKAKIEPVILTDEEIMLLTQANIKTKDDILKVCNLEEKYLNSFYKLINNINNNLTRFNKMSKNVRSTLIELEKKLFDINKRNRMLYLPKLPVTMFDLASLDFDPLDILFRNKALIINNNNNNYKYFNNIYRDATKMQREKGINDLYIAYNFIKGKLADDFYIHAPLVLFPVTLEKKINGIKIKLDNNRDITYNNHLLLANYKLNGINKKLPNTVIEDVKLNVFLDNLIDFYKDEGISFFACHNNISRFREIAKEELKIYRNGDYSLEGYVVIGRFSSYSTVLQHDFRQIIEEELSTDSLNILFDQNSFFKTIESNDKEFINYLGELNSSQENVIKAIRTNNQVVIEGPPGTGKSQTICSLISNFLFDNKKILVVSEKKAALDVVYSRLGELNKFVLQIDDINNKEVFYNQLAKMLEVNNNIFDVDLNDLDNINKQLLSLTNRLENIENLFYRKNSYNIKLNELYMQITSYDEAKAEDKNELKLLTEVIKNIDFKYLDYNKIKAIYDLLNDYTKASKLVTYMRYESSYLALLRDNLTDLELVDLRLLLREIINLINEYNDSKMFNKLKIKSNIKKRLDNFINKYHKNKNDNYKFYLENEINIDILANYDDFVVASNIYHTLDDSARYYLSYYLIVIDKINHDLLEANHILFNYLYYKLLVDIEAKNANIYSDIYNFDVIIDEIDKLYTKKKALIYKKIENNMLNSLKNIKNSDNYADFNHNILSAKRKYNLNRFINKFQNELNNIKVYLMTPEVVSEVFDLYSTSFDLVIFDEASQLYIEKSIPTIFRANKLVIAGDSKQLRPSSLGSGRLDYDYDEYDDNIALEEESLLDVAKFKILPPKVLNFHYRSRFEELISFSNYAFYNENLYIAPNTVDDIMRPIEVYKVNNGIWIDRTNLKEAQMIVNLLKATLKNRKNKETIGIITFNSSQRDLIEDLIEEEQAKDSEFATLINEEYNRRENGQDIGLFVKNIENVQGDERDIIMFSIAYAKGENNKLVHNFGWLNQKGGENRLNVAITRAKQKIIVVTSITPNELNVENSMYNGPKLLKKYLEYCYLVSNKDIKNAKQTLYSLSFDNNNRFKLDALIKDLYQELSRRGFTLEYNVGVGKYMVDVAVKQGKNYILGIEFDTKLYNNNEELLERDYFRRKYMKSRGWNIYRLFSMSYTKNKKEEINRILDKIYLLCMNKKYEISE